MEYKQILSDIIASSLFPVPSPEVVEAMSVFNDTPENLNAIANIIKADVALATDLLQYANTEFISTGSQVVSIHRIADQLGAKSIVHLALGFSLLSGYSKGHCHGFNYTLFWAKSLARATAAKFICNEIKAFEPDKMFVCGLLARFGELAFSNVFAQTYAEILRQHPEKERLTQLEIRNFGISSEDLTAEIFRRWNLSQTMATGGIHQLYQGKNENTEENKKIHVLQLADQIAELCQFTFPQQDKLVELTQTVEKLGISASSFPALYDKIISTWKEWGNFFKIQTQSCPLYNEIKTTAQETHDSLYNEGNVITFLIVDDDPISLLNLDKLLSRKGHTVLSAKDGEEALQLAFEHQPQVVITDWKMPKLSGLELCKKLRTTPETQNIYIIMVTGMEGEDMIIQAFDAGADDYVVKPFTPKVLEARIRSGKRIIRYQNLINHDRKVIQQYAAKLSSANQQLQTMAMTDALTGLPNRRYAMERLRESIKEATRHGESLSCIMLDIDEFKAVNDTYGHDTGDRILKEIAEVFHSAARTYDTICRIGGEEFLIISSRNDAVQTRAFAERLRRDIEARDIVANGKHINITASFGVAQLKEGNGDGDNLINQADKAMYRAKKNGKNRVEVY